MDDPTTSSVGERSRTMRGRKHVVLIAALAALIVLGYFAQTYMKLLGPPERCWEIQERDGRIYKVNPCTGQFRLLGDVRGSEDSKN